MEADEQQPEILLTNELLKARGYEPSSSWGLSEAWRHKENHNWWFGKGPELFDPRTNTTQIRWHGLEQTLYVRTLDQLRLTEERTPKKKP